MHRKEHGATQFLSTRCAPVGPDRAHTSARATPRPSPHRRDRREWSFPSLGPRPASVMGPPLTRHTCPSYPTARHLVAPARQPESRAGKQTSFAAPSFTPSRRPVGQSSISGSSVGTDVTTEAAPATPPCTIGGAPVTAPAYMPAVAAGHTCCGRWAAAPDEAPAVVNGGAPRGSQRTHAL